MRGHKGYAVAFIALAILAGRGLYARFQAGYYTPTGRGTIRQIFPLVASTDAVYGAGEFPAYPPVLAAGDGRQEVEAYCGTCHSSRYITMQPPLPAGAWADEVNKMVKTYGASVPGDAAQKIIQYLGSHYTPETRKH
jgi:mono/diheme cytochrome c family protein